jgi:hypothetical protein
MLIASRLSLRGTTFLLSTIILTLNVIRPCSMAAVITTTMTLRIILSVRGPLQYGGSFACSSSAGTHSAIRGIASARAPANATSVLQIASNAHSAPTYTLDGIAQKAEHGWDGTEGKTDILSIPENDHKAPDYDSGYRGAHGLGVKVTVEREMGTK